MNPFDLRGPEFLVFYAVFALAILVILRVMRGWREGGAMNSKLTDAYLIAYLRAGSRGAIETALVSLIDRKILEVDEDSIAIAGRSIRIPLADSLERAICDSCATGIRASKLQDQSYRGVFDVYDQQLERRGLIPDESLKSIRNRDFAAAALLLGVVAGIKIIVALSRGRGNIVILIIFAVLGVVLAYRTAYPRLTVRGEAFLADLKQLWTGLRGRVASIRPHGGTEDLVYMAALFGVITLPEAAFPQKWKLFQREYATAGSSGSSCGSSSGDSGGGSSCGGGGSSCGSGCGGCGGGD